MGFIMKTLCTGLFSLVVSAGVFASDIGGSIQVTRRLTRKRVTPVVAAYHRGTAVTLARSETDLLAEEMGRVAIYLEGVKSPSAAVTAELAQKDREFLAEVVAVPVGSTVSFPNRDPIFHNVFSLSRVKTLDLGNYPQDQTRTVTFAKPGIVPVYCHLHPNMTAVIVVAPSKWVTMPGGDGRYLLRDVPAGRHTLVVWHKAAGYFRREVEVRPGQDSTVNFFIPVEIPAPQR